MNILKFFTVLRMEKPNLNNNEWAQYDNKVLFYPEEIIIRKLDNYLRSYADNPDEKVLTKLVVYNQ
ncbi:hypothetical protein [Polaribacter vadi]|uniref:hypothetical protein n=1 Tax=Polaribacter vadi TaxID=1774273 RepID=UPI001111F3C9|nr:hypothetical protein [Polaribacter vadi]